MEDKRRDAGNIPASSSSDAPQSGEQASSRRRGGGLKRKASALNASNSSSSPSSAPSKRLTREKNNASMLSHSQIVHNGPLTRARQGPSNLSGAAAGNSSIVKKEEKAAAAAAMMEALEKERQRKVAEEWAALEAKVEAEIEAVRSRGSNVHVVPNHCGWFSWTKAHLLEERSLPSFFNGKTPNRTPDMYLEIRNWIVKKFHSNPNVHFESKDLSELEVGDLEARQEVLEFLDYWGLINFHPFLLGDVPTSDANGDGASKKESLLEKLYHFETNQSSLPVIQNNEITPPTVPAGSFSESTTAEELVKPEGPSVEYHCNSCSADCSRKRYHCQKEADFDLCTECFTNGKFGSGMSTSDFILMEPGDVHGTSGGSWTDQETLLLLEAIELFKDNWNEIAEHVATKTRAQCMLHFVQMPIEDAFLDRDDGVDGTSKENADPTTSNNDILTTNDVEGKTDSRPGSGEVQAHPSPMEITKLDNDGDKKVSEQTAEQNEEGDRAKDHQEISKQERDNKVNVVAEKEENYALKALTDAFEAVGYSSTSDRPPQFVEVGNPVMALAGFLARLVRSDVATALARSSLKPSGDSPGIQLALKHCFVLADPPDSKKEPAGSDSAVTETVDHPKDGHKEGHEVSNQEGDKTTAADENASSGSNDSKKIEDPAAEDNTGAALASTNLQPKLSNLMDSSPLDQQKDPEVSENKLPLDSASGMEDMKVDYSSQLPEAADMVTNSAPAEEHGNKDTLASDDPQQQNTSTNGESEQSLNMPKDVSTSPIKEKDEPQQPVAVTENGSTMQAPSKEETKENPGPGRIKDPDDRIKRAALSAVSAAAVKAKLLAEQEEDQIRELTVLLIEKQLHKLERKLAFFNDMESVSMRVREQLERSRQRLYHERAQIIAARLNLQPSSLRAMAPSLPANRIPMSMSNMVRGPTSMPVQRPPFARPIGTVGPNPSNPFVAASGPENSSRPPSQENPSSIATN